MAFDPLLDRIKAHRSAPDVYDPPTFDKMAERIFELEAKRAAAEAAVNAAADTAWDEADEADAAYDAAWDAVDAYKAELKKQEEKAND